MHPHPLSPNPLLSCCTTHTSSSPPATQLTPPLVSCCTTHTSSPFCTSRCARGRKTCKEFQHTAITHCNNTLQHGLMWSTTSRCGCRLHVFLPRRLVTSFNTLQQHTTTTHCNTTPRTTCTYNEVMHLRVTRHLNK